MTDAVAPDKTGTGSSFDLGAIFTYGLTRVIDANFPETTSSPNGTAPASSEGTGTPTPQGQALSNNPLNSRNLMIGGAVIGGILLTVVLAKGLR